MLHTCIVSDPVFVDDKRLHHDPYGHLEVGSSVIPQIRVNVRCSGCGITRSCEYHSGHVGHKQSSLGPTRTNSTPDRDLFSMHYHLYYLY